MNVLIVDDDEDTVESLAQFMEIEGIDVAGKGYNGEEAYQLYKEHKPDIVLLDMKMPRFDGDYAIKKIKKENPNAKIIVITGYTDYIFERDDAAAIFTKPYDIDEVISAIRRIGSN